MPRHLANASLCCNAMPGWCSLDTFQPGQIGDEFSELQMKLPPIRVGATRDDQESDTVVYPGAVVCPQVWMVLCLANLGRESNAYSPEEDRRCPLTQIATCRIQGAECCRRVPLKLSPRILSMRGGVDVEKELKISMIASHISTRKSLNGVFLS
ncbi:uncharacterized protein BJX67DRAFT_361720 [Aspergillus lucknowensis]|uniref:Uncharacterized protein n=1 Tax=Aspergillus lucknowensis TaxID=176173 RepID=A0ABR4LIG4_9EURO